jgi:hypothetical protein
MLPEQDGAARAGNSHKWLEFMLSRNRTNIGDAKAACRALLIFCLVLGAAGRINAAGASRTPSTNSSPRFDPVFAIADFDGDRKPDLATVEIQSGNSSGITRYSIHFQLTAGSAQSFGVSAPAGGLQIVARDVNGDDALDLLVSTAWLHQQVAVLLNDGHGKFSMANPGAFPGAVWESDTLCESGAPPHCDSAALVRSEYSAEGFGEKSQFHPLESRPGQLATCASPGKARLLLFSLLGRAPPSLFSQA